MGDFWLLQGLGSKELLILLHPFFIPTEYFKFVFLTTISHFPLYLTIHITVFYHFPLLLYCIILLTPVYISTLLNFLSKTWCLLIFVPLHLSVKFQYSSRYIRNKSPVHCFSYPTSIPKPLLPIILFLSCFRLYIVLHIPSSPSCSLSCYTMLMSFCLFHRSFHILSSNIKYLFLIVIQTLCSLFDIHITSGLCKR
jgi:hypothetical protein